MSKFKKSTAFLLAGGLLCGAAVFAESSAYPGQVVTVEAPLAVWPVSSPVNFHVGTFTITLTPSGPCEAGSTGFRVEQGEPGDWRVIKTFFEHDTTKPITDFIMVVTWPIQMVEFRVICSDGIKDYNKFVTYLEFWQPFAFEGIYQYHYSDRCASDAPSFLKIICKVENPRNVDIILGPVPTIVPTIAPTIAPTPEPTVAPTPVPAQVAPKTRTTKKAKMLRAWVQKYR